MSSHDNESSRLELPAPYTAEFLAPSRTAVPPARVNASTDCGEHDDDDLDDGASDRRKYLIFTDESGIHGAKWIGYGSLWIPLERRGDIHALIKEIRQKHCYWHEIKWNRVAAKTADFFCDVVRAFFGVNWQMFHAYILPRVYIDMDMHRDMDEALQKHFVTFITSKIAYFNNGASDKEYHLRVDPLPSSYKKADEAAHVIVNHSLQRDFGMAPLKSVVTRDSKRTLGIQIADLLLGASLADLQGDYTSEAKRKVVATVAEHLNWMDMRADTLPHVAKFNIWAFYDPTRGARRYIETRPVVLKFPMRVFKRRR